ncbi:MAG: DUF58 domain-containing protein [Deltaproteobacteria bacterium]|nr:DUF58 domain-containing protein [Deltaproteobacteria bacterium]
MPLAGSGAESVSGPPRPPAAPLDQVFTAGFLRKLERLQLRVRQSLATRPGNTPMPRGAQASGLELASHKDYAPGDDLRHLDWNAFGRLDQLLIKTFRAEREAALHLLLDCSASMAAPASDGKFAFASALAAAVAYISLRHNDPVRVVALAGNGRRAFRCSPWFRHRDALARLRDYLASLQPAGTTTIAEGVRHYAGQVRVPGVAVLLSDFLLEPAGYESALQALAGRGWTAAALRVLGPAERDPGRLFRRGRLCDSETGAERVITLTAANRARYQAALQHHLDSLRTWCQRHALPFSVVDPSAGLEHALFYNLPAAGIVK